MLAPPAQIEQVEQLLASRPVRGLVAASPQERTEEALAQVAMSAHEQVVEDAEAAEEADVLERARDAERRYVVRARVRDRAAGDRDRARGRTIDAGHAVEERRLARAVRTDERDRLALGDLEAHVGESLDAAEAERQAAHLEQRYAHVQKSGANS